MDRLCHFGRWACSAFAAVLFALGVFATPTTARAEEDVDVGFVRICVFEMSDCARISNICPPGQYCVFVGATYCDCR